MRLEFNNGVIVQYGKDAKDKTKLVFPISFSNELYTFTATMRTKNDPPTVLGVCCANASITGIYVYCSSSFQANWIAIGY